VYRLFARNFVPCLAFFFFFFSQKEKETKVNADQIRRQRESFVRGREKKLDLRSGLSASDQRRLPPIIQQVFPSGPLQKPRCRDLLEGRLGSKKFLQVTLRFLRASFAYFNLYFNFLQSAFSNGRQ
jgi:hypothetical protein